MVSVGPASLWQHEARTGVPHWPRASARLARGTEVLVVGAGLCGLGVARALARRGADVWVVDARGPGAGASGRNAGFVLVANPTAYPALRRRLGAAGARRYLGLARRTQAILRDELGHACDYEPTGSLTLAMEDAPEERRVLQEAAALLREDGVPCSLSDSPPPGLCGFSPVLAIPEDGQLHPGKLAAHLAAGVRGFVGSVSRIDPDRRTAEVDGVTVPFRRAYLCTNGYAPALLPRCPVAPHRAQVLALGPLPTRTLRPVCYAGWGYDYFRQRADGVVLVGGRRHLHRSAEATDAPGPTVPVQLDLEAYVARHLPFARSAPVRARWSGTMGFAPHETPVVAPWPASGSPVTFVGGFTGHGLGLALAYAEHVVEHGTCPLEAATGG